MVKRRNILKEMKVNLRLRQGSGDLPLSRLRLSDLEAFVDSEAVKSINEDLDGVHRGIANENIVQGLSPSKLLHRRINNVVIATDETVVAHSLGKVPYDYRVVMKATGGWYQTKDPDPQNVYIAVAAGTDSVTADIIIEG